MGTVRTELTLRKTPLPRSIQNCSRDLLDAWSSESAARWRNSSLVSDCIVPLKARRHIVENVEAAGVTFLEHERQFGFPRSIDGAERAADNLQLAARPQVVGIADAVDPGQELRGNVEESAMCSSVSPARLCRAVRADAAANRSPCPPFGRAIRSRCE